MSAVAKHDLSDPPVRYETTFERLKRHLTNRTLSTALGDLRLLAVSRVFAAPLLPREVLHNSSLRPVGARGDACDLMKAPINHSSSTKLVFSPVDRSEQSRCLELPRSLPPTARKTAHKDAVVAISTHESSTSLLH